MGWFPCSGLLWVSFSGFSGFLPPPKGNIHTPKGGKTKSGYIRIWGGFLALVCSGFLSLGSGFLPPPKGNIHTHLKEERQNHDISGLWAWPNPPQKPRCIAKPLPRCIEKTKMHSRLFFGGGKSPWPMYTEKPPPRCIAKMHSVFCPFVNFFPKHITKTGA